MRNFYGFALPLALIALVLLLRGAPEAKQSAQHHAVNQSRASLEE